MPKTSLANIDLTPISFDFKNKLIHLNTTNF